ncbi:MAG: hypothetical protein A2586_02475 [Candidatus Harrisonbacteria bacterium RIFOXYD1_FULL_40_9]|uniref:Uncharacterized protein n=1 Tax=Candidatus Harrisonbacteria bacterium RIFOXYD1_FULL_40_9 TaxID=1798412 RepID=A0A1G1ZZ18_9BACT|nr:MAG: hypothetical protein A2586_02475 [Candidatus Harrisonbacteria bacterium RIFOXYD1_FULL_40_9]
MKIINIILGIATAIILTALIHLGIKAFYPEPEREEYLLSIARSYAYEKCKSEDTKCMDKFYAEERTKEEEYRGTLRTYNRNLFIIANIVGILVFAFGFLLLFKTALVSQSVPIGIMVAGLYSIVYGYGRGWNSTDDKMKFFVGLVIAVLVIGGSIWLMQRYYERSKGLNI